jgi:hypothetical protein
MLVKKFVCHSKKVLDIARQYGWKAGARYTNLRDVRHEKSVGFLDIDWKNYNFEKHIAAAQITRPGLTVAQDIVSIEMLPTILGQAEHLLKFAKQVIVVPKDIKLSDNLLGHIPSKFILGYSVPTRYGGTEIPLNSFDGRPVHLLGGRPDVQRELANDLNVVSLDTNRFTLDASYGDYFDGKIFKPHPKGGYDTCIRASLNNMNKLWKTYRGPQSHTGRK